MSRVIVGVDPHKKSVTIEVVDGHGTVLARGRYGTDTTGYRSEPSRVLCRSYTGCGSRLRAA
jgi:hypothetical protein